MFICRVSVGNLFLDEAGIQVGEAMLTISGDVDCSGNGCPASNTIEVGTVFNRETQDMCPGGGATAPPTTGGRVCLATVRIQTLNTCKLVIAKCSTNLVGLVLDSDQ